MQESIREGRGQSLLDVRLADSAGDLRQAQRLRHFVFAEEMGASLPTAHERVDRDAFDEHCRHLIVEDQASGRVVGTYPILEPCGAAAAGGRYAETEFDLARLAKLRDAIVEVWRACVDPDYRHGAVITLLWAGLLRFVLSHGYGYLMGSASVPVRGGGHDAASVCRHLLQHHLGPEQYRVFPRFAFVLEGWREVPDAPVPSLIRGYLRLGAVVCGDPAWDPAFRTADLLVLLEIAQMSRKYVDRLLRPS